MINVAQVVAAAAGGALLTICGVLMFWLYYGLRDQAGHGVRKGEPAGHQVERESAIDAAALIAVESFETMQARAEDREARAADLPRGTVVVRSKGHLKLIGGAVAALVTVRSVTRDALRAHRTQIVSSAVGTATLMSTVTALTMTPWSIDGETEPPAPAPSASQPPVPASALQAPRPDLTVQPAPSDSRPARQEVSHGSPSPSGRLIPGAGLPSAASSLVAGGPAVPDVTPPAAVPSDAAGSVIGEAADPVESGTPALPSGPPADPGQSGGLLGGSGR